MEDIHLMLHKGDWIRNLTINSVYSAHPACLGQCYVMDAPVRGDVYSAKSSLVGTADVKWCTVSS